MKKLLSPFRYWIYTSTWFNGVIGRSALQCFGLRLPTELQNHLTEFQNCHQLYGSFGVLAKYHKLYYCHSYRAWRLLSSSCAFSHHSLVISDLLNNYRLLLNVLDILLMSKVHKQVEPFSFYSIPQHQASKLKRHVVCYQLTEIYITT